MRKTLVKILILTFVCLQAFSFNAVAQCQGKYMEVLTKDTTITTPCFNMVLMNLKTYSMYYDAENKLNEIRELIPELKKTIDSIETVNMKKEINLDLTIDNQKKMLELQTLNTEQAISKARELTFDIITLEKEVAKEYKLKKRWRTLSIIQGSIIISAIITTSLIP